MHYDLNHLMIFKHVVDFGSFTQAAQHLKQPKSSVSQKIAALERSLGVTLLHRSTRHLGLTEAGERIYELSKNIARQADEIATTSEKHQDTIRGLLRISVPLDLGLFLMQSAIAELSKDFPDLQIEVDISNRYVDLVREGFDLAIRATERPLQDSTLISQKIGSSSLGLYAAPSLIERCGDPASIEAIADYQHIWFGGSERKSAGTWIFHQQYGSTVKTQEIPVSPALRTNDFVAAMHAVKSGIGIGVLPRIATFGEVEAERLLALFPDWYLAQPNFYAVYPSRKFMPAKLKAAIDRIMQAFARV